MHPNTLADYRQRTEDSKPMSFGRRCHRCKPTKSQVGGYTRKPRHKFDKGEFYCEICRKLEGK